MLFYFACEAAGASAPGIPHALLMERRKDQCTTRAHSRRENADTRDPHSVIAREGGRSSIAEEPVINRQAAAGGGGAIHYGRGAGDQSTGRGVLDTRFRGYDDWAGPAKAAVCVCERR